MSIIAGHHQRSREREGETCLVSAGSVFVLEFFFSLFFFLFLFGCTAFAHGKKGCGVFIRSFVVSF
jgi:hypothetical protein